MTILSWKITVLALLMLPVFIFPARWVGRRLAAITREAYSLNAEMNAMMSERFNVAGALLVKIFGRPDVRVGGFRARTGRVRDIGVTTAMYARIFFTGPHTHRHHWRRRWFTVSEVSWSSTQNCPSAPWWR